MFLDVALKLALPVVVAVPAIDTVAVVLTMPTATPTSQACGLAAAVASATACTRSEPALMTAAAAMSIVAVAVDFEVAAMRARPSRYPSTEEPMSNPKMPDFQPLASAAPAPYFWALASVVMLTAPPRMVASPIVTVAVFDSVLKKPPA